MEELTSHLDEPIKNAQKAFNNGYLIEAIQIIHGYLEFELQQIIYLSSRIHSPHENFDLAMDILEEVPYSIAVKTCYVLKAINNNEKGKLTQMTIPIVQEATSWA